MGIADHSLMGHKPIGGFITECRHNVECGPQANWWPHMLIMGILPCMGLRLIVGILSIHALENFGNSLCQ